LWPAHAAAAGLLLRARRAGDMTATGAEQHGAQQQMRGPSGHEISMDCCTAGDHRQMRAVPRCQLTQEVERRPVLSHVVCELPRI